MDAQPDGAGVGNLILAFLNSYTKGGQEIPSGSLNTRVILGMLHSIDSQIGHKSPDIRTMLSYRVHLHFTPLTGCILSLTSCNTDSIYLLLCAL